MLSRDAIARAARHRTLDLGVSPGMAVGLIGPDGRAVICEGRAQADKARPVVADTLFEIGSITKAFTALLLADAVLRGELDLDDPIERHLFDGARVPQLGRPITLRDLAIHASGLPTFLPGSPPFGDPAWSDYTQRDLLAGLAAFQPVRAPGEAWDYSNTGYALIGMALERRSGLGFEALLRARVVDPLGMTSTAVTLTPDLEARTATPHTVGGAAALRIALPAMACAGALWSDAGDMLTFLAAALGLTDTPLAPAFAAMLRTSGDAPFEGARQALGWLVLGGGAAGLIGHDGGTVGMSSSALFDTAARTGLIVLANAAGMTHDFAVHLMRPDVPLTETAPRPTPQAFRLGAAQLDRVVGRYELAPGALAAIERDGDSLALQAPGAPRLVLQSASAKTFFASAVELIVEFDLPDDGPPIGLTIRYGGRDTLARRLEG